MSYDEDGYWLECVRRSGSNSATSGYQDIVEFVLSGQADDKTLSGMSAAFRSLHQECNRQISARREAKRLESYK